jgi:hypothetical protein
MSTRNKNVRQDVAFRVVSCFTDTRTPRPPCVPLGMSCDAKGNLASNQYYIFVVRLFGRLYFSGKKKPFRSLFFWWFFLVMFQFAEPTTSIFGGPDMHVHEGSPVNLSCLVSQAVGQPEFFFWYHNGQVKQQQNKFKSFYTCVCCWWFSIVSYSHRQLRIEC